MQKKILLVDGYSIANRAFYGIPLLSNAEGVYTNAAYGFFNILIRVMKMESPTAVAAAFDLKAPTFRHKMYADYKGTRSGMPQELLSQIPIIEEMLQTLAIPVFSMEGYEADDLLGTLARHYAAEGADVTILSGDRDLLQLADEKIKILIPKTQKGGTELESYYPADVVAKYGADPAGYLQMKALMGDSSDNIPGVPSIGEKTAAKIIAQFGTIEEAIAHADEVKPPRAAQNLKEYADQARFSLQLATICTEVPIEDPVIPTWEDQNLLGEEWISLLKKYNFRSLLERFAVQEPKEVHTAGLTHVQILDTEESVQAYLQDVHRLAIRFSVEDGQFLGAALQADAKEPAWTSSFDSLKPVLADPGVALIGHDIKEELRWMLSQGVQPGQVGFDTMVAAYLLNPSKDGYTIAELASVYNKNTIPAEAEILGTGAKRRRIADVPKQEWIDYAGAEVHEIVLMQPALEEALRQADMLTLYDTIERPLIEALASMENEGIRVEPEVLRSYGAFLKEEVAGIQQRIYDLAGEEFNINSPKQLGQILFEKLALPAGKKTKTGYSTSVDVLDKLKNRYPIVADILQYRQLSKLESTYVEGLIPCIQADGKIHCRFQQTVTATGRLSSTDPNLQNIPIRQEAGRQLRKAFVPRGADWFFMDADYSQIELRLLAHMSADANMIQVYRNGEDIHTMTASQVFGLPQEMVTPAQRSAAKAVSFGIVYGISAFSLSDDLHISQKEAADYIERYFAQYPSVRGFLNDCVQMARENGYGVTIFGRKRPIDELKSSNFNTRSFGERVAKNMPIQGSAADIIKIAMIHVYERIRREGLKSRLIVQVHDELLMEVYRPEEEAVRRILEEEMMGAADLLVPLEIDVHTGENWYEAK